MNFILQSQGDDRSSENLSDADLDTLNSSIANFIKISKSRWSEVGYSQSKLEKKNATWLSQNASVSEITPAKKPDTASSSKAGRPSKDFSQLSKRSRD